MRILTTFLSLAFAVVSFSQSDCGWQPDSDENNFISVTDILAILAVFGQADVDQDGIWDASDVCIDPEACNYAADPSVPCEFLDAAGICGGSNDIPALLIGSWALSTAAGAVEVGPSPGSNEWYSSGSNGLQSAQYDDIYTFQTNGSLIADYNGSIIDAFADYSEQGFSCTPIDFDFNASDTSGDASTIELSAASTSCSCPFIGTNDAGLIYTITTLTSNTLQLQAQGDDSNCNEADLYFTFTFVRLNNESGDGTGYPAPESYPGMTLVWSDEFDGSAVNTENWTYDLGASGWGQQRMAELYQFCLQQRCVERIPDHNSTSRRVVLHLRPSQNARIARFSIRTNRHSSKASRRPRNLASTLDVGHFHC